MLIDARTMSSGETLPADLCIIGGGAAGITIALEFVGKPLQVILLESGGLVSDPATQSLYAGENVGLVWHRPDTTRSRFFGGSTNCWGGWCRPLDPIDFEKRPWIPNSGWPFSCNEIEPFYKRSHELLKLGPYEYDEEYWKSKLPQDSASFFRIEQDIIKNVVNQFSPPARFGELYRKTLDQAPNIRVLLNANATELVTVASGTALKQILVSTLDEKKFIVVPKTAVLATGGIENARLLLLSNRTWKRGLGNAHDLVGRYFADHPSIRSSKVRMVDQKRHRRLYDGTLAFTRRAARLNHLRIAAHLVPTANQQREAKLPNSRTYLMAGYFDSMSRSYTALKTIRQQLENRSKFGVPYSEFWRAIRENLPILFFRAPQVGLALCDVALTPEFVPRTFSLETVIEPVPNPDSRVTLSPHRDRLGMNQVRVDWRLTEEDRQNFVSTHRTVLEQAEKEGILVSTAGASAEESWTQGIKGCWHHMGTTRMDPSPRKGVVDADCRVHGVSNLYIAGSSIFPTFGCDMPTMTVVALAIRLSRRIESALRTQSLEIPDSKLTAVM